MSTDNIRFYGELNIRFYGELMKIILQLSSNTLLIASTDYLLYVHPFVDFGLP